MQSFVTTGTTGEAREQATVRGGSPALGLGVPSGPAPVARAGTLLASRYRLTKLLGRGGHGLVFQALDSHTQGDVAVKLLARSDEDSGHTRRFLREAEILGRLHHPNTVRVLDSGQGADGTMYLVMERVLGQSLEATLRQRLDMGEVLSEADTTAIALQVLGSLREAHALGLVHRDIKPSNIMLDEQDGQVRAKVLDFGIAQTQESSLTATGKVMGTPTYMSPEQCLGMELDGRSDLYALAALMYRCVSGRSPFDDPNALTVMYSHVNVPPRDLATVAKTALSAGFVDVVMRGLAKAPEQRFADGDAMRRVLERADEEPADAPVRSLVTHTASPLRLPARTIEAQSGERVGRRLQWPSTALPWLIALGCLALLVAGRTWPAAVQPVGPIAVDLSASLPMAAAAKSAAAKSDPAAAPKANALSAQLPVAPAADSAAAPEAATAAQPRASRPHGRSGHSAHYLARRNQVKDDPTSIVPPD